MSSPSLSSYTSLTPRVPQWINLDGKPPAGAVAAVPVPAHPAHHAVLVIPDTQLNVAGGFLEPSVCGFQYTHAVVVNRMKPGLVAGAFGSKYRPVVTSAVDGKTSQILDPLCGAAWTSVLWLLAKAGYDTSGMDDTKVDQLVASISQQQTPFMKLEAGMLSAVLGDAADVDVTRYTGSANMGFHGKVSVHGETMRKNTGKIPFAVLLSLDAYGRKQWRRGRNWVKPTLMPAGIDPAEKTFTLDEWAENSYGLNAYDVQHPDASELHRMYVLTGHPIYLLQMLTLFATMKRLSWYLRHETPPKHAQWSGVARIPGWWATNLGELVDALVRNESPEHVVWLSSVLDEIEYLLTELEHHTAPENWPLAGTTGSAPAAMKNETGGNVPYQMAWQFSPLAWGLQWIEGACRNAIAQKAWLAKQENGTLFNRLAAVVNRARALWKFVLDYVEKECFRTSPNTGEPEICYALSKEFEPGTLSAKIKVWQQVAPGTGMWHLAPLAAAGRTSDPKSMGGVLLEKAKQIDKTMTGDLAEMCPALVGKATLVPEIEHG